MSRRRVTGGLTAVAGLLYYVWHAMQGGPEPHAWWAFIGAAVVLIGVWFLLSPVDRAKADSQREKAQ